MCMLKFMFVFVYNLYNTCKKDDELKILTKFNKFNNFLCRTFFLINHCWFYLLSPRDYSFTLFIFSFFSLSYSFTCLIFVTSSLSLAISSCWILISFLRSFTILSIASLFPFVCFFYPPPPAAPPPPILEIPEVTVPNLIRINTYIYTCIYIFLKILPVLVPPKSVPAFPF